MNKSNPSSAIAVFLMLLGIFLCTAVPGAAREKSSPDTGDAMRLQTPKTVKLSKQGIDVEMSVMRLGQTDAGAEDLMEGEDVELRFKITDSSSGSTLSGISPAAWIDPRQDVAKLEDGKSSPASCEEKVGWFLQGSLALQPAVNLNTYYILALNDNASISVIDPQLGFYISKLLTFVPLKSPGEDWVLTRDGNRLFVTMPKVGQVAVVDTGNWKVVTNLDAGPMPVRVALQPDEKYLWVGNDAGGEGEAESGVTILDADQLTTVARIKTGAGHHELAFSDDSRYGFVSNRTAGTVSIIDIRTLAKVKEIKTGSRPVSMAYSSHAKALYVAHDNDGRIVAIGGANLEAMAEITAKPGLREIRFSPDGRWGFAVNFLESVVHVLDSSVNQVLHEVAVEPRPDHVSFSPAFAYIRPTGSTQVNAIQLSLLGKEKDVPALKFPAGSILPEKFPLPRVADVIVPTPEGDVVLVANPMDKTIYYYMEGMLAPMGTFQNYGRLPRGVLVVDRSLKETAPGVFSSTFKLPPGGSYDVAFLLDSPLMHLCFDLEVKSDPASAKKQMAPLHLEFLTSERTLEVGEPVRLLFKVTVPGSSQPEPDLKDIRVLQMSLSGAWQDRVWARPVGGGLYEVDVAFPEPGYYRVFFECPSRLAAYRQLPHLIFQAVGSAPKTGTGVQDSSRWQETEGAGK